MKKERQFDWAIYYDEEIKRMFFEDREEAHVEFAELRLSGVKCRLLDLSDLEEK